MKEFHIVFAKATNKTQLALLLKDSYNEIVTGERSRFESVMFFNKYYNLDFSSKQLVKLGRFIESGKFERELERYL